MTLKSEINWLTENSEKLSHTASIAAGNNGIYVRMNGHEIWQSKWNGSSCQDCCVQGSGSYGLNHEAYKTAMESLSSIPLSVFLSQRQKPDPHLQGVISCYQSLSEHELVNIRDLFCFLMGLIHDARKTASKVNDITCKKRRTDEAGVPCSWAKSDIERVEEAMLRVLRAVSGSNWVL